jgi:hypothetical protein
MLSTFRLQRYPRLGYNVIHVSMKSYPRFDYNAIHVSSLTGFQTSVDGVNKAGLEVQADGLHVHFS